MIELFLIIASDPETLRRADTSGAICPIAQPCHEARFASTDECGQFVRAHAAQWRRQTGRSIVAACVPRGEKGAAVS